MTVQIFYNQNAEERLVNLVRVRKCLVGLSILLVYGKVVLVFYFCEKKTESLKSQFTTKKLLTEVAK